MRIRSLRDVTSAFVMATLLGWSGSSCQASQSQVEAALANIVTLNRPGQDGLATIWDGNKYIQCRRTADALRCEAGGALMQPSLGHVLVPERIARLATLGWQLDPSFGNYVQVFPIGLPVSQIAERILQALRDGYDANPSSLETQSDWIRNEPCPPRNGPGQNLAGMINDSPAMSATAVYGCAYRPKAPLSPIVSAQSKADLLNLYGARIIGEIQRLRVNIDRRIFIVFETGGGYVQCAPQSSPRAIYCEAQSAESWPVLARILTPDRVARLRAAGFADPGRAPNYWKTYPTDTFSDTAIADELATVLFDVYGYNGSPSLKFVSEKGPE
jgi:hypothetical protein